VLSTYFITLFRLGWGWLFIILAVCATYYSASIERVRRSSRDDIQRELVKTRLLSEHESADWLNNFLDRFWLIYEPVLSATIVASVDPILSASTPGFLDSLRMTTFTLGSKAPRIERVRTFPNTPDDVILMDWTVSFNSTTDSSQPSSKRLIGKTSSKIVLDVRFGKGIATAGIPILIENMDFSGEMRVKLKLINSFPHVQIVELSFLTKPNFSFVLKPIGGDAFGFDIANVGINNYLWDRTWCFTSYSS
jgi:Ca2+-dependent lipid-binding protein